MTIMRWSQLNFVAIVPNFVMTQFKEKAKNFVVTITQEECQLEMLRQIYNKDKDIEAASMLRHS